MIIWREAHEKNNMICDAEPAHNTRARRHSTGWEHPFALI